VPYGRQAVVPVALDGSTLTSVVAADAPGAPGAQGTCARPPWGQTRFAAVLDAAEGRAWPRGAPGPCWTTQLRRLNELAQLLGLAPAPPAALGEELARLLEVPRLSLLDDTGSLARAVGFKARGELLVATLERIPSGGCLLGRVLACGVLAGLWRPVQLWRRTPSGPRRTVFPGRGTPSG
jgi:hypothetical protein